MPNPHRKTSKPQRYRDEEAEIAPSFGTIDSDPVNVSVRKGGISYSRGCSRPKTGLKVCTKPLITTSPQKAEVAPSSETTDNDPVNVSVSDRKEGNSYSKDGSRPKTGLKVCTKPLIAASPQKAEIVPSSHTTDNDPVNVSDWNDVSYSKDGSRPKTGLKVCTKPLITASPQKAEVAPSSETTDNDPVNVSVRKGGISYSRGCSRTKTGLKVCTKPLIAASPQKAEIAPSSDTIDSDPVNVSGRKEGVSYSGGVSRPKTGLKVRTKPLIAASPSAVEVENTVESKSDLTGVSKCCDILTRLLGLPGRSQMITIIQQLVNADYDVQLFGSKLNFLLIAFVRNYVEPLLEKHLFDLRLCLSNKDCVIPGISPPPIDVPLTGITTAVLATYSRRRTLATAAAHTTTSSIDLPATAVVTTLPPVGVVSPLDGALSTAPDSWSAPLATSTAASGLTGAAVRFTATGSSDQSTVDQPAGSRAKRLPSEKQLHDNVADNKDKSARKFRCFLCPRQFALRVRLRQHWRVFHGKQTLSVCPSQRSYVRHIRSLFKVAAAAGTAVSSVNATSSSRVTSSLVGDTEASPSVPAPSSTGIASPVVVAGTSEFVTASSTSGATSSPVSQDDATVESNGAGLPLLDGGHTIFGKLSEPAHVPTPRATSKRKQVMSFRCSHCPQQFTDLTNLSDHSRAMHPDRVNITPKQRNFRCDYCPRKYTTRGGLDRHLRIHRNSTNWTQDAALYMCRLCDRSFEDRVLLRKHRHSFHLNLLKSVMPRKKFLRCTQCPAVFNHQQSFDTHVYGHRSNMEQNSYPCELCGWHAPTRLQKSQHLRKAHGRLVRYRAPTACTVDGCSYMAFTSKSLRQHLTEVHQQSLEPVNLQFPTLQDFDEWRHRYETENGMRFIRRYRHRLVTLYVCERSRRHHTDTSDIPHDQQETEMGSLCTATLRVRLNGGPDQPVNVEACLQHSGHA